MLDVGFGGVGLHEGAAEAAGEVDALALDVGAGIAPEGEGFGVALEVDADFFEHGFGVVLDEGEAFFAGGLVGEELAGDEGDGVDGVGHAGGALGVTAGAAAAAGGVGHQRGSGLS